MSLSKKEIQEFQSKILIWYQKNKRDLPWRRTHDPYRILVSEVMLQQTQVSRVIPKYEAWLTAFPTVNVLAKASVTDVLRLWMGLGYNRRALYLKKCAEALIELRSKNYELRNKRIGNNYWPQTEKELMRLPGIGEYTARALLCFAFGKQIAVVDTNVKRVILTQFQISNFRSQAPSEKDLQKMADLLLPKGKAYEWNQALMDYASSVLKKEKIPIPKQSTYLGSDRYYRAKILKLLLAEKKVNVRDLGLKIRSDFTREHTDWLEGIILSLEKDGLVERKNKFLTIRH